MIHGVGVAGKGLSTGNRRPCCAKWQDHRARDHLGDGHAVAGIVGVRGAQKNGPGSRERRGRSTEGLVQVRDG